MIDLGGLETPRVGSEQHGRQRRAIAARLQDEGHTNKEIGYLLGVTAQHVSYMLNPVRRERSRVARGEEQRRAAGQRSYVCGVCGERGHNARRHRNYRPEDVAWMKSR